MEPGPFDDVLFQPSPAPARRPGCREKAEKEYRAAVAGAKAFGLNRSQRRAAGLTRSRVLKKAGRS